jgi:hypothetical protein
VEANCRLGEGLDEHEGLVQGTGARDPARETRRGIAEEMHRRPIGGPVLPDRQRLPRETAQKPVQQDIRFEIAGSASLA